MMYKKLKIKSTWYPTKKLSFNATFLHIHNELNKIKGWPLKIKL
jgi:hypothetical protein